MPDEKMLFEGLNDAQLSAVKHDTGPLLIVAGAGTGKTTVLTRRYAWLMREHGLKTDNILALTFTEKAAGEMEDRVLDALPNGTYDFWISTFHGFCQRVLEEKALEIGLPNRFKLLNETDAWLLLKRHIEELPLDHYRPLGNPVKFLGALLQHISRAKDENVSPDEYLRFAEDAALDGDAEFVSSERKRLKELADLAFAYRRLLREEGALDFGDLIQETLRLFRERPYVLQEFRERFPFILVDEFQDTNWAQYELVRLLAGESRNLTVVGDDDQAIYKFRGASLANILQFRDDYPDAKTVTLTENYRSHQEILDLAYGFITKNDPNRLEIRLKDTGLSKKLRAVRGDGGDVRVCWYRSVEEESRGVAERIRRLKDEDISLSWNDIAVLVRSNDGAEPFVRALEALGIPFRFYAMRGLYTKPVILDVTSLLHVLVDKNDSVRLWRVLQLPMAGLDAKDTAALMFYAQRQKGVPLWDALKRAEALPAISDGGKKHIRTLVAHLEGLAEAARREPPLRVLQLALEKTGLLRHILSLDERSKIEQIEWMNSFANRVKRYEAHAEGPHLKGFLEELDLEIESGEEGALKSDPNEGPELVKVMTVHGSKGLEFRHVFLVSLVDQRFPTRRRSDPIPLPDGLVKERLSEGDAHLEEERRLFYVALTRARDSITLTGAEDYGGVRAKKPSPFLAEAGLDVSAEAAHPSDQLASLEPARPAPENTKTLKELYPLKRRFSFTQLAAFRNCPLQYKFAHVYRIPILGSYQKSFGQSMHLSLHDILKLHVDRGAIRQGDLFASQTAGTPQEGFRVSKDEAEQIYRERWIDEWYPSRIKHDEYFHKGLEAIRGFWKSCFEHVPPAKYLELPFDWRIGQHSLKGAIDRIDELPDGSVALFDYKTGHAKDADSLVSEDKEQLRLYQLAMEHRGFRVSRLALIYVLGMVTTNVELLEREEKISFTEKLQDRMNAIVVSEYSANPSTFVCRYCDFKDICEYRKL
ncbi:ATP-dependent helicase [candidate division WWE3 bacterium]|uniref:DNA 3'-5' helicase n=1 Tax=candidate division WWE3 bacterium TaxID=2053526 RepID=A0A928Y6C2_UNCKA|nr:ATP-dependent helicase [candidate division WWE3 bacterium]